MRAVFEAPEMNDQKMSESPNADCYPISVAPGLSRLFLDFCAGDAGARAFYASVPGGRGWQTRPSVPAHWPELVRLLAEQNSASVAKGGATAAALDALRHGAGVMATGQQVGLFGGPLFTPFKAATAVARARQASAQGFPHAAVFWIASEDHDFAEISNVTFPARRELRKLEYSAAPEVARPAGSVVLDDSITALAEQARELLGPSDATEALEAAYKPGNTFAQAFAEFYSKAFSAQGLLVLDASGRAIHRMGAPVLRAALERADELHAALLERNGALEAAGYHAQVTVAPQSSLLFLIDEQSGARMALKRNAPTAAEPDGLWTAGGQDERQRISTSELLGILEAEPERISPSALLRPVFQDFLLSTSLMIGGPAEVAYLAQSAVLFERILGRATPVEPRFSATLVEPAIAELLRKHELTPEKVFQEGGAESLAQTLAARAMPVEGRERLTATSAALDAELAALVEWLRSQDEGLGRSAETAASKIEYQMNRLRTMASNFQLQKEASLGKQAQAICQALYPEGTLQERVHGAAYYFARVGFGLAEEICAQAANACPGHTVMWM